MEVEIDPNMILDHASFQISSSQNSFEAFACSKGNIEKIASGHLDQLELHLPLAKGFNTDMNGNFRLELPEDLRSSSWFTKSTLARFLHFVNEPELFKIANAIQNELNQLEETRRFHHTLYKDNEANVGGSSTGIWCLKGVGTTQKVPSDATKNELLRALDLRVIALNEELAASFNRALGNHCSEEQISELAAFIEHFAASDLRNCLSRYLSLDFHSKFSDTLNEQSAAVSHDSKIYSGKEKDVEDKSLVSNPHSDNRDVFQSGISPAKIAQAERESSTDSEDSSNSCDEVQTYVERSRPAIRSASPRRSASPMRRVQIARCGSRRSTALSIKSLNCFPARERTLFNREGDENNSGDDLPDQQPKKPENSVLRMTVQDKINLFEKKQRETSGDQKTNNQYTESSFGVKKSVLRRWSAGMGDSTSFGPEESISKDKFDITTSNQVIDQDKNIMDETPDSPKSSSVEVMKTVDVLSLDTQIMLSPRIHNPCTFIPSQSEESQKRAASSAEWTRQKEAELNQMLMNMMEKKPSKYASTTSASNLNLESCSEQKGNFYSQYKEIRDQKLQAENAGKEAEKEAKFKVMRNKLVHRKAEMSSKLADVGQKLDSSAQSQKARRNSSPPVIPKMTTNSVGSRKVSSKSSSPMPAGRSSLPSVPSPRTVGTPPSRISSGTTAKTIPNRRKPQPTPLTTLPAPRTEKQKQTKVIKGSAVENRSTLKAQNEKKQKATKSSKNVKPKSVLSSGDDSSATPAKPSLYNKVTKKSSVVPLESKPFLRKGTGIGSGVAPSLSKTKPVQYDNSSKNSENVVTAEKDSVPEPVEEIIQQPEEAPTLLTKVDMNLEEPISTDFPFEKALESNAFAADVDHSATQLTEFPTIDIQADDDSGISSSAWVEVDHDIDPVPSDLPQIVTFGDATPVTLSSPHVRHSLSQMLQAESTDTDTIEWGNAEIPPALIYQKDAPKGLKRLLNFARKNKGEQKDAEIPSFFSEGEEDAEEPKFIRKRNPDASTRKGTLKGKATGLQRTMLAESYDGGDSSKSLTNHSGCHESLSASMNGFPAGPHKLRGQISATVNSTKATRSFFSLSTFRSNKSSEAKLH